jgi:hypothetical protein
LKALRGIGHSSVELIDITKPDVRKQQLKTGENELPVAGVTVYKGRVSAHSSGFVRNAVPWELLIQGTAV